MIMNKKSGFSMIEIMIVLMIMGIILATLGPQLTKWYNAAGGTQVKLQLNSLKGALQEYFSEFGVFPTTREGLQALLENPRPNDERYRRAATQGKWPFISGGQDALRDKAGNELTYACPPVRFKDKYKFFEIIWNGPSGEEGDPKSIEDGA